MKRNARVNGRQALNGGVFLLLCIVLTFCAGSTAKKLPAGPPTQPEQPAQEASPYRVSFLINDGNGQRAGTWGMDEVSRTLKEQFDIEIELLNPSTQYESSLRLLVSSDSLPDILHLERDHVFRWLVEDRKLLNLEALIGQYNGYVGMIGKETLELSRYKGSAYTMLSQSSTQPNGTGGWILNETIYHEMGSPPLRTLADMEEYLAGVRGKFPSLDNGLFALLQMGVPLDYSQLYVAHGGGRVPENCEMHIWFDPESDQFVFIGEDPAFAETFLLLRRLYSASLINENWFVEQNEQVYEVLSTKQFALLCAKDITGVMLDALTQGSSDPDAQAFAIIEPLAADGVDSRDICSSGYSILGKVEIAINANADHPERIYRLLDWIASAEGQRMVEYGPRSLFWDETDESGFPIFNSAGLTATAAEKKEKGLGSWNFVGIPVFVHESQLAVNRQLPESLRDTKTIWKETVMDRYSHDVSLLQNITPHCDGLENTAKILCGQLVADYLPRIIGARSDEEALRYLDELNHQVDHVGFDFVLNHYNWQYRDNTNRKDEVEPKTPHAGE